MKELNITLVSDNFIKGCGLDTYYRNLYIFLKKKKVNINNSKIKKLFGNYPVLLSSPINTHIAHFTDQKVASIIFFSFFRKYKAVVTVHDVTEIINFKNVHRLNSLRAKIVHKVWNWFIVGGLKKADAIITVSKYTKKDLSALLGSTKNIHVIYESADNRFKPQKVKRDYNSILYIGSDLAHKNVTTLIKAFALVQKKIPKSNLILVGSSLSHNKNLSTLINKLGLEHNIICEGYVENASKEYSKAGVFVFPSLYEGFGLPVLEAMACGCPVICSNRTSLPEVGGDAALYFDGYDIDDLTKKMYKVLTDKKLHQNMVKKGFEQAKKFNWEKTAEETIQVYKQVSVGFKK